MASVSLNGEPVVKPSGDGFQTHGGIAVLMPYAGRVQFGKYRFQGRSFELPVGSERHAIHGFAKDEVWTVVKEAEDSTTLTCRLESRGYPGILDVRITYSVTRTSFSTECSVKNVGHGDCPFVAGFHPYFLAGEWKLSTDGDARRYLLRDAYFPTGERVPYSFRGVGAKTKLDDCIMVSGPIRLATPRYNLLIRRRSMPYLVVYDGRYAAGNSVAIEPYTGLPDAFNNGIGLRVLKPSQNFECGYDLVLR